MKKLEISKEELTKLVLEKYTNKQLAKYFNCSVGTIKNRKNQWYISSLNGNLYSKEEDLILIESLYLGDTYKNIRYYIFEDLGIDRTTDSLEQRASLLGIQSKNNKLKTNTYYQKEIENKTLINIESYINDRTKILHKCFICYNVWNATPNSILVKRTGCPKCATRNQPGGYGRMSEEIANTIQYPLYLYHIKLQLEDEVFYKYGLTSRLNKQRFKEYKPYTLIEEISFIRYDAWDAICKEKALKSNYTPKHHFSGWTECYI